MAWTTLALGVGSWLFFPVVGALGALVCGMMELRKIKEGTSSPDGEMLVTIGLLFAAVHWLGLMLTLVFAGGFLFLFFLVLLA